MSSQNHGPSSLMAMNPPNRPPAPAAAPGHPPASEPPSSLRVSRQQSSNPRRPAGRQYRRHPGWS